MNWVWVSCFALFCVSVLERVGFDDARQKPQVLNERAREGGMEGGTKERWIAMGNGVSRYCCYHHLSLLLLLRSFLPFLFFSFFETRFLEDGDRRKGGAKDYSY